MRKKLPRDGDIRVRTGFLLLPLALQGEMRWLERAKWTEEFSHSRGGGFWLPQEWVDE